MPLDLNDPEVKAAIASAVEDAKKGLIAKTELDKLIQAEVNGLKEKNQQLIREKQVIQDKLAALPEGADPAKIAELIDQDRKKTEELAKLQGNWDEYKAKLIQENEAKLTAEKKTREEAEGRLNEYFVSNEVRAAMAKAGVDNQELLMPHLRARVQIQKSDEGQLSLVVVGEDGKPRSSGNGDGKNMSVLQLLDEMKADKVFAPAFPGSGASGGGAGGGGKGGGADGANPWKKDSFNLTLQGQLLKSDPDKAARLRREAGAK